MVGGGFSRAVNLDPPGIMGGWRCIYFVCSMEMCVVTVGEVLSCVWRLEHLPKPQEEVTLGKVMTSSYSSNAAALVQEEIGF